MIYEFQGFRLYPDRRQLLSADGKIIPLTTRVFDTLLYLVEHRGKLLDKDTLMQAIWPGTVVEENRLNQVISALRKALGEKPAEHRFILTDPGRGYRFVSEVQELDQKQKPVQPRAMFPTLPGRGMRIFFGLLVLVALAGSGYLYLNQIILHRGPEQLLKQASASISPTANPKQAVIVTPPPSIAVLPFVNMSPDKSQEYFADGVTEEVLNQLSRIRDLFTIGRESSFSFKGKHEDLRVIGEKLGASYLLEGSVRKEGQQVRITAQLVKAADGHNLWSRSYDRDLEDIFAIQEDIAKSVAQALEITLGVGELGRAPGMTHNVAAYDAYLNGRSMFHRLGRENVSRAIEQLEKATELDPNFALAWSSLGYVYIWAAEAYITERSDDYFQKSVLASEKAITIAPVAIDPLCADALLQSREADWVAVETDYKKALRLMPLDARTNEAYGNFLTRVGRPHDAIEYLQRAVRSEPLSIIYALSLGVAYEFSGNFKAGRKEFERGKSLEGDQTILNLNMSALAMETGNRELLKKVLDNGVSDDIFPSDSQPLTGTMLALLGSPEQARAELHRLYNDPKYNYPFTHYSMAHWASYFNDHQLALKIYTELSNSRLLPIIVLWRPLHKEMRKLPGFKDLVTKIRLVDYWRTTGDWGEFCHPVGNDDFECE